MTSKQRAKIYRKAAKLIDSGKSYTCCFSIATSSGMLNEYYRSRNDIIYRRFIEFQMFCPSENYKTGMWWPVNTSEGYECRVLALLLAAEIAEDGGTQ